MLKYLFPITLAGLLAALYYAYHAGVKSEAAIGEAERLKNALEVSQESHASVEAENRRLADDHASRVADLHAEIERLHTRPIAMDQNSCAQHCSLFWPSD